MPHHESFWTRRLERVHAQLQARSQVLKLMTAPQPAGSQAAISALLLTQARPTR